MTAPGKISFHVSGESSKVFSRRMMLQKKLCTPETFNTSATLLLIQNYGEGVLHRK